MANRYSRTGPIDMANSLNTALQAFGSALQVRQKEELARQRQAMQQAVVSGMSTANSPEEFDILLKNTPMGTFDIPDVIDLRKLFRDPLTAEAKDKIKAEREAQDLLIQQRITETNLAQAQIEALPREDAQEMVGDILKHPELYTSEQVNSIFTKAEMPIPEGFGTPEFNTQQRTRAAALNVISNPSDYDQATLDGARKALGIPFKVTAYRQELTNRKIVIPPDAKIIVDGRSMLYRSAERERDAFILSYAGQLGRGATIDDLQELQARIEALDEGMSQYEIGSTASSSEAQKWLKTLSPEDQAKVKGYEDAGLSLETIYENRLNK